MRRSLFQTLTSSISYSDVRKLTFVAPAVWVLLLAGVVSGVRMLLGAIVSGMRMVLAGA